MCINHNNEGADQKLPKKHSCHVRWSGSIFRHRKSRRISFWTLSGKTLLLLPHGICLLILCICLVRC